MRILGAIVEAPTDLTIVDAEELGGAMTEKLAELFDESTTKTEPAKPVRSPKRGRKPT